MHCVGIEIFILSIVRNLEEIPRGLELDYEI